MALTNGTNESDTIFSTRPDGDWIAGNRGGDYIFGSIGPDRIYGGRDADHLWGGDGDDLLQGGPGNDRLDGGAGRDLLRGGPGSDVIVDADGGDGGFAWGQGDDDIVYVSGGIGTALGGKGDDIVGTAVTTTGYSHVRLFGGPGADVFAIHGDANASSLVVVEDFEVGVDRIAWRFDGESTDPIAKLDADGDGIVDQGDYPFVTGWDNGEGQPGGLFINASGRIETGGCQIVLTGPSGVYELHAEDFFL